MTEIKTINQIRDEGLAALIKALGPGDAIRYINSFEQGTGGIIVKKNTRSWMKSLMLLLPESKIVPNRSKYNY
ncbi:hypothetical protein KHC33_07950 [Methanospirillum sp. J.3.6.1-F.2.7.3]|jgi:hypothetical protein|uniref:Uncharacterized protein n=1 Tax=Methanospirillum purgamenti TaxID=2834276 RepID=A0A8E7EIF1_9EURY|nr:MULTISPECIES: hypothetical protein [Methanospirillum]MDX8550205.1 hypothetical protein [Methanospirillum hungatei]NLW75888.1 hypothetical protein [Methanomicrobiales archaeon]QVV90403.1 hypothetical protein KHC33_07950 [Methanospirillum sp. J.3.6.1-F.2.7.3]